MLGRTDVRGPWLAGLLIAAGLIGIAPVAGAQVDEKRRLAKMAAEAESAEQHLRVAREYRERADLLESQAARLERTARRLERGQRRERSRRPAPPAGSERGQCSGVR